MKMISIHEIVLTTSQAWMTWILLEINYFDSFSVTSGITEMTDEISRHYTDGLVQDWNISIAYALEMLQSCTRPWI